MSNAWIIANGTASTLMFSVNGKQVAVPAGGSYTLPAGSKLPTTVGIAGQSDVVQYGVRNASGLAPTMLPLSGVGNGAYLSILSNKDYALTIAQVQTPSWQIVTGCSLISSEPCPGSTFADITQPGMNARLYVLLYKGALVQTNMTSAQQTSTQVNSIPYRGGNVADALVVMDPNGTNPVLFGLNNSMPQMPPVLTSLQPAVSMTVFESDSLNNLNWVGRVAAPRNPSIAALLYLSQLTSTDNGGAASGTLFVGTDPSNPSKLAVNSQGMMGAVRRLTGAGVGAPGVAPPAKSSSSPGATTISLSVVAAVLLVVAVVFIVLYVMQTKKSGGMGMSASKASANMATGGASRYSRWGY